MIEVSHASRIIDRS